MEWERYIIVSLIISFSKKIATRLIGLHGFIFTDFGQEQFLPNKKLNFIFYVEKKI